jgi:protein prenyltransferase alpha subunit repeat containing protein 1
MDLVEELYLALHDNDLDELGLILHSDSPNIMIVERKLGVSMKVLKPIFLFAIDELVLRRHEFNALPTHHLALLLDKLSLAALVVKGDFPPAFNSRKELLEKGYLDVEQELRYISLILSKHPKSSPSWYHRKWCLERLIPSFAPFDWHRECALCARMCDLYPKNYYAWNHRMWVVNQMSYQDVYCFLYIHFCSNTLIARCRG